jgi:hypothetical protein
MRILKTILSSLLVLFLFFILITPANGGLLTDHLDILISDAYYLDYENDGYFDDIKANFTIDVDKVDPNTIHDLNLYIYLELPSGKYFQYLITIQVEYAMNSFTLIMYDHALEYGDYYLYLGTWLDGNVITYAHAFIIFDPPGGDDGDPDKGIEVIRD